MPTRPNVINLARTTKHADYDAKRKLTPELAEAARIRSTARWRRLRGLHRHRHPLCCNPFDLPGHDQPNEATHHIEPLAKRPDLAYAIHNLAPLCTACHNRIEAMERAGKDTRQFFPTSAGGGGIESLGG